MKIYSKDSLKIGEYGFVRDLHPAFNVSDNIAEFSFTIDLKEFSIGLFALRYL